MQYQIVRQGFNKPWWSSFGWVGNREDAEWLNESDIEVLLPHFKKSFNVAAIQEDEVLIGWHYLDNMARVEVKHS